MRRVPPRPLSKPGRRPQNIQFAEDEIVRAYYKRNPSASLEPIDLGSFEPTTARRFASRQIQLMEQGLSRRDASIQTREEFAAAAAASREKGIISTIQSEEEGHLKQAMQTYTERHGHKPLSQMSAPRQTRPNLNREAMRRMDAPPVQTRTSTAPTT